VARLLHRLPARTELVIEFTGVGRPVADMSTAARLAPTLVLTAAGTAETYDGGFLGVSKLALISRVQALLHEGRLKIHKDLTEAPALVRELRNFPCEYIAGSITFNAGSGRHDDLVLSLAIAVCCAFRGGPAAGGLTSTCESTRASPARRNRSRPWSGSTLASRGTAAIAVVRKVPASRLEEQPDRPAA
jgi:hypothetical protein